MCANADTTKKCLRWRWGQHFGPAILYIDPVSLPLLGNLQLRGRCRRCPLEGGFGWWQPCVCDRGVHHHRCLGAVERSQGHVPSWDGDPPPHN